MRITAISNGIESSRDFYDDLRERLGTHEQLLQISLTPTKSPEKAIRCLGENLATVSSNMVLLSDHGDLRLTVHDIYGGKTTGLGTLSQQACRGAVRQGEQGVASLIHQAALSHQMSPSVNQKLSRGFYDALRANLETRDVLLQISVEPVSDPDKRLACWSENLAEVTANMRQLAHRGPLKVSVHELHNGKTTQLGELSEDDCLRATQRGPAGIGALITQAAQEWQRRVPAMDLD